jgi:type IV secretion system protein VirB4
VVCQLDLRGFDAELAVISGRSGTVDQLHELIAKLGPEPDNWLEAFMTAHRDGIHRQSTHHLHD